MTLIGIATTLVAAGVVYLYVSLVRPQWLACGLGFVIGAIPLAKVPILGVPLILALTAAVALAAVLHQPFAERRLTRIELAILVMIGVAAASVPVNITGLIDLRLFIQWLAATSITLLVLRTNRAHLHQFGVCFVWGAAVGMVIGFVLLVRPGWSLVTRPLMLVGYKAEAFSERFVFADAGRVLRLVGTYGDPNGAAVTLFAALLVTAAVFRGRQRTLMMLVLLAGIGLTLSRAVGLSIVVAVVVVALFQPLATRVRWGIAATLLAGAATVLAVPATRTRLLSSFSSTDVGSSARLESFLDYPHVMSGRWLFGLGWGRTEFWDPTTAWLTNYVSNAPLIAIYRGGIGVGIAFVVVVGVALVISYRGVRSGQWNMAMLGAGFIGFASVGMQLDHPIVTLPPIVSAFAIVLAFIADMGRQLDERTDSSGAIPLLSPNAGERPEDKPGDPTRDARGAEHDDRGLRGPCQLSAPNLVE